jgi:hypothetical protein
LRNVNIGNCQCYPSFNLTDDRAFITLLSPLTLPLSETYFPVHRYSGSPKVAYNSQVMLKLREPRWRRHIVTSKECLHLHTTSFIHNIATRDENDIVNKA